MKLKLIVPIISLFLLFNCSVNNDDGLDAQPQEIQIFQWHLINVTGGIAVVDIDFELDTIIWVFSVDFAGNGSLQVENNNTDDTLEDAFETGTYSVSIPASSTNQEESFLFVNGDEFGHVLTPTSEDLIINQNIRSNGETGSDGFIYTFKREVITQTTN